MLLEPGNDGRVRKHLYSYGQSADEKPNHRFHSTQGGRPAGGGAAEHDVLLSAVPAEENRPGSLHERAEAQPSSPRQLSKSFGNALRKTKRLTPVVILAARIRDGTLQRRPVGLGETLQGSAQEGLRGGAMLAS